MSSFSGVSSVRCPPSTDGEEGLRVLRVLTACQHSLEQNGAPIETSTGLPDAAEPDYFVHPTTTVDSPCKIGSGTKIWHYSHIMRDCEIGSNCTIGQNVVVSPHCIWEKMERCRIMSLFIQESSVRITCFSVHQWCSQT